jgi:hypothetical protein
MDRIAEAPFSCIEHETRDAVPETVRRHDERIVETRRSERAHRVAHVVLDQADLRLHVLRHVEQGLKHVGDLARADRRIEECTVPSSLHFAPSRSTRSCPAR